MKKNLKIVYVYQAGIGLIELMISMLIGLFIMAGVLQMFSTTSHNAVAAAGSSRIQENIRYAFSRIAEDVSQSGNLGCMSAPIANRYAIDTNSKIKNLLGVNTVPVTLNSLYDFQTIVHGTDAGSVIGAAANTDVFRIRYLASGFKVPVIDVQSSFQVTVDIGDANFGSLNQWQIVGLSNCDNGSVFMLTSAPTAAGVISVTTTASPRGIYNTDTEILGTDAPLSSKDSQYYIYGGSTGAYEYFIGNSINPDGSEASCSATTREQCSLRRRVGGVAEELVQGVHDMEVFYGSTSANGNLTYRSAASVTDWSSIDRIKVTMMFNSIEDAQTQGNNISGSLEKTVSRTFNLFNQL